MYKSDIERELKKHTGSGMITATELAKFMGYSRSDKVAKYLVGLPRIGKKYFICEVAESLKNKIS
ncbi:MAG: hypothetical protein RR536_01705 [Anaerovoracaceae bacterium]